MTIGALIAVIQALVTAYPAVKAGIESICADVAAAHGLDPVELIKAVTTPNVAAVDSSIDAEILTRFPS